MLRLAWSVYSPKDFAETKTVTGHLSAPDPEYSQQDPDLNRDPALSRLVKDNGDYSSEFRPEASSKNRSTTFHRRPGRRLPRPRQRALVDPHKPDKQSRVINTSFPVLPTDRRHRHPNNYFTRIHPRRAHTCSPHSILTSPARIITSPHCLVASTRHVA